MGLFSFFNRESRLEDLLPEIEKLDLGDYLESPQKFRNCFVPYSEVSNVGCDSTEIYIYNGYLITLCRRLWLSKELEYLYYIHQYSETNKETDLDKLCYGVRYLVEQDVLGGSKEQVFLAACKRVDDIILANEGF
jgi:hypothetical protein